MIHVLTHVNSTICVGRCVSDSHAMPLVECRCGSQCATTCVLHRAYWSCRAAANLAIMASMSGGGAGGLGAISEARWFFHEHWWWHVSSDCTHRQHFLKYEL